MGPEIGYTVVVIVSQASFMVSPSFHFALSLRVVFFCGYISVDHEWGPADWLARTNVFTNTAKTNNDFSFFPFHYKPINEVRNDGNESMLNAY